MGGGGSKYRPSHHWFPSLAWRRPYNVSPNNVTPELWGEGQEQSYYQPAYRWDPARGCNKNFKGTYKCGSKDNQVKNTILSGFSGGSVAYFDCRAEHDVCINFRLELTNSGELRFTDRNGNIVANGNAFNAINSTKKTNETINPNQRPEDIRSLNAMVLNNRFPTFTRKYVQYMYPSQSLLPGEYLCSASGNCFLALVDGVYKVCALRIRSAKLAADSVVITGDSNTNSSALYELNGLNVDNLGKVANISIDGKRRMFSTGQVMLGKKYVEITGKDKNGRVLSYDNPGDKLENVMNDTGAIDFCFDQCSNRDECGGFVVSDNDPKMCQLKTTDLFPVGNRVQSDVTHLYKRLYAPKKVSESCMKPENTGIVAIDSVLFDHYPTDKKDPRMTRDTLCGVDQLVETPTTNFDTASANLASIYDTIMEKIQKTISAQTMYNLFRNDPGMDVGEKIDDYSKTTDQIKAFTDKEETVRGAEEDTRLALISETYKYIVWSIVAVIIIIVIVMYGDIGTYANLGAITDVFKGASGNESSSSTETQ
jgi:hypothetical protein